LAEVLADDPALTGLFDQPAAAGLGSPADYTGAAGVLVDRSVPGVDRTR
jgi:hypothetical protein